MRSYSFRTSTGTIVYTGHWSCHGMDTQRTIWSCLPLILMWLCQCSAAAIAAIACPRLHSMMTAWVWQYALPRNPCIDSGRWFCSQSVFDVYLLRSWVCLPQEGSAEGQDFQTVVSGREREWICCSIHFAESIIAFNLVIWLLICWWYMHCIKSGWLWLLLTYHIYQT